MRIFHVMYKHLVIDAIFSGNLLVLQKWESIYGNEGIRK